MKLKTVSEELKTGFDEENDKSKGVSSSDAAYQQTDPLSDDRGDDLSLHRFECRSCGYIYDPKEGLKKFNIQKGTPFFEIDRSTFRCPVCRAKFEVYKDIGAKFEPSGGIEENLNYGFGFNNLPPGQKNILIFGGLAFFAACFLSLYSLH